MRGKPEDMVSEIVGTGITPACAGKTDFDMDKGLVDGYHPRVCGENNFCLALGGLIMGSPPRVRGKLPPVYPLKAWRGITPACAGKTH